MELLIVNPRGRKKRKVRRRRKSSIRVRRMGSALSKKKKKKVSTKKKKRSKASSKKKGASMAKVKRRKRVKRKATVRRRKPAKRSTASRRKAALKGIRRKKAKASVKKRKRKVVAKKAKRKTTRRKVRRKVARRAAPMRRRRKARKNPAKKKSTSGLRHYRALQRKAKSLGLKATGTAGQLEAKIARKSGLSGKRAKRKYTRRRKAKRRSTAMTPKRRSAKRILKSKRKAKRSTRRAIARTYLRASSIKRRAKAGKLSGPNKKLAQAYGLTRVNPSMKAVWKDLKTAAPMAGVGALALVGGAVGGYHLAAKLLPKLPASTPKMIKDNAITITTGGLTLGAFAMLKKSKKMQKYAMPVLIGGIGATALHALMTSVMGRKLLAKLGMNLTIAPPTAKAEAVEEAMKTGKSAGLGSYMTVSQYLGDYVDSGPQEAFGAYGQEFSQMGPSWYGRGDISPVLNGYVASDFPLHTPGPGDNTSVHATLMGLGDYGQQGVFGAAYPPGGYDGLGASSPYYDPNLPELDYTLEDTPGGTVLAMGEAGIFGGKTALN